MNAENYPAFQRYQRLTTLTSYAAVVLMLGCLGVGLMQVGQRLAPGWQGEYLPWLIMLVGLEAIYAKHATRELDESQRTVYTIGEIVLWVVVVKILIYLLRGVAQFLTDLARWQANFLTFVEGEYLPVLFMVVVVWFVAKPYVDDLEMLHADISDYQWEMGKLENDRQAARARLLDRIFGIGFLIVFLAILVRMDLVSISVDSAPLNAPVINVLAYFMLALIFLSLTQFALLRGRWFWQKLKLDLPLVTGWIKYSVIFFGIITLLAFILPSRFTLGFLETLGWLLGAIITVVTFIFSILMLPFGWLLSLFSGKSSEVQEPAATPSLPPTVEPPLPAPPWLEVLQSVLFWAIFLGVIGYFLYQYARQNPMLAQFFKRLGQWQWLKSGLGWLRFLWRGAKQGAARVVEFGRQRLRSSRLPSLRVNLRPFTGFRSLSPRQQIIYFFVTTTRRAAELGTPRQPAETPIQYAARLESALPDSNAEIAALTDAFIQARYTPQPISADQSHHTHTLWQKVIQALRQLAK